MAAVVRWLGLRAAGPGVVSAARGRVGWAGGPAPRLGRAQPLPRSPQAPPRAVRRSVLAVPLRAGEDSLACALGAREERLPLPPPRFARNCSLPSA